MAIAGTRARLVTFEPVGPITARNVQDAVVEAAGGGGGGGGGGGSQTLAEVLVEGSDPDGTPITGPLEVTLAAPGTPLALFAPGVAASLATGSGNSGLVWSAVAEGAAGNNLHIEAINGGDPNAALDVFLNSPTSIGITYATDGAGAVTSTAAQVRAAVNADPGASPLVVVALAGGSNGSGLMADEVHNLAGGVDGVDQDTFEPRLTTLPIGDTAGVSIRYFEDQIGNGNQIACLVFPEDTTAFAIAIEGDEFPRYIFGADPENNGITMGDGSSDATGGPGIYYDGGDLGLNNFAPQVSLADVLNEGNNAGAAGIVNLLDPSGDQDAATKKYVDDFPVVVPDSSITTAKLAGDAVTAPQIADGAVTEDKIASGAVTENKIGLLAVLSAHLSTGAVTEDKIASGAVTAAKTNLPTSNPGPGLIWNDGGVWKVGT